MFLKRFIKTVVIMLTMTLVVSAQNENVENEQRVLEAERRALDAERRALEAERRAFELESSASVSPPSPQPPQSSQRRTEDSPMEQKWANYSGSVGIQFGWNMVDMDALGFDLSGMNASIGADIFFPIGLYGMLNLGFGASVGYVSVESDNFLLYDDFGWSYNAKYGISATSLRFSPTIRLILGERSYFDVDFAINFPLSAKETLRISGFPEESFDIDNDISLGISIGARYNYFGASFYLPFDSDAANGAGLNLFLPLGDTGLEAVPSFAYWFDSGYSEIVLGIRLQYGF